MPNLFFRPLNLFLKRVVYKHCFFKIMFLQQKRCPSVNTRRVTTMHSFIPRPKGLLLQRNVQRGSIYKPRGLLGVYYCLENVPCLTVPKPLFPPYRFLFVFTHNPPPPPPPPEGYLVEEEKQGVFLLPYSSSNNTTASAEWCFVGGGGWRGVESGGLIALT